MQDTPGEKRRQDSLWQRLARNGLWPLLLAEVCFALVCLGVGWLVWRDVDQRHQQEARQGVLQTYRLQASLIDQQLADQQQHLRQLGRATRRLLQSDASPSAVVFTPAGDGRLLLSPNEGMALFGEAVAPEIEQPLESARRLYRLEPLMSDLYHGDALIKRLYVSLPQGLVAMIPGTEAQAGLPGPVLEDYRFEENVASGVQPLRWRVTPREADVARLELRLDVLDAQMERLAQVGLELDNPRLAQLVQEHTGFGNRSWLVNARGESLMGATTSVLPNEAGRRGVVPLENAEGRSELLVWAPLPTTGWRLASHLSLPDETRTGPALGWVMLAWIVGSLLILIVLLMILRQRMQRWEHELDAPVARMGRLRQRLAALVPSWLAQGSVVDPGGDDGDHLFARLDGELDALETTLARLANQPRLPMLIEALDVPMVLTHDTRLVAVNAAFEQLVGRSQGELLGLRSELLLVVDEAANEPTVCVQDADGRWRLLRCGWSEDDRGHGLTVLIDESEFQHQAQQLSLARDHARQDSQLKTRYLTLLRRELEGLSSRLESDGAVADAELRERFSGLRELLDSLSDDAPNEAVDRGEQEATAARSSAARVLIVDDGPVNTALAHNVLSRHGLKVDTAGGGEEALMLADRHFYDLVFMDIFMPSPDGIETSRRWREREGRAGGDRRSVLVALTANASEIDREHFFAAGMDDYLAKPYRPQALIDMIHRWLPGAGTEPPRA